MESPKPLANNIKQYRIKLGITQQVLAEYLDITREEVSYYESGKRPVPLGVVSKLANLFGLDEYVLYEENGAMTDVNLAFALRAERLEKQDLQAMAEFKKLALNYLKMKKAIAAE